MILGLDLSTSNVGFCFARDKVTLIETGYIHLAKTDGLFNKVGELINQLQPKLDEHKPDVIIIEDSLKQFVSGRTSADVVIMLAQFNGIVSYLFDSAQYDVRHVNPVSARKLLFGKAYDRKNFNNSKEYVRHKIDEIFPWIHSYMPHMKKFPERLDKKSEDVYDAIVIALSHFC